MKKKQSTIVSLCVAIAVVMLASCSWFSEPDPGKPSGPASRSVLVYMVANNNLSEYDYYDLREMETAARRGDLGSGRLLIYHVAWGGDVTIKEVRRDSTVVLRHYTNPLPALSVEGMRAAIDDFMSLAPANDYGIVFWSHSSGWIDYGRDPESSTVKRSFGNDARKEMSIPNLAKALAPYRFSFAYFDCCFMGNVESLYELRFIAPYVAASPAETPVYGMPYDKNIACFFADKPQLEQAARNTFNLYNQQSGRSRSCVMSVYNMSAMTDLARAVKAILRAYPQAVKSDEVQQYGVRTFANCFYDLNHYVSKLVPTDSELYRDFDAALRKFVVYTEATPEMALSAPPTLTLDNCCGLSTYIVGRDSTGESLIAPARYNDLQWWADVVDPQQ